MAIIGINGSPRKTWNTATLLEHALKGAASEGAETELVHLYDLDFQGCTSCFACKLKGGKSYGRCALRDDLTPVLERIHTADALILGSPFYFGTVTGEMHSCMERIFFPSMTYAQPPQSIFGRKIPSAFIYTMNVSEKQMQEFYSWHITTNEQILTRMFGNTDTLCSCETLQFDDYDKYVFSYCDPEERRVRHKTVFPEDCKKAFDLGKRLAKTQ